MQAAGSWIRDLLGVNRQLSVVDLGGGGGGGGSESHLPV